MNMQASSKRFEVILTLPDCQQIRFTELELDNAIINAEQYQFSSARILAFINNLGLFSLTSELNDGWKFCQ